jgi:hypothetical protein
MVLLATPILIEIIEDQHEHLTKFTFQVGHMECLSTYDLTVYAVDEQAARNEVAPYIRPDEYIFHVVRS